MSRTEVRVRVRARVRVRLRKRQFQRRSGGLPTVRFRVLVRVRGLKWGLEACMKLG